MRSTTRGVLIFLLAVGVLRGLLYPIVTRSDNPGPDGYDYLRVAHDFLAEPFPWNRALDQSAWAPGWPAAMALVFKASSDSMAAVRWFNVVLWIPTLWLTFFVVRRLFDADLALLATTLVAWDNLTNFIKYANYEVFLTFLVVATQACLLTSIERRFATWMAIAGLLSALACLCQGKCVVPLVALALATAVVTARHSPVRSVLMGTFAFGLAFTLVVLPYSYRNYLHEGRLSFVASVGAPNLVIGNGPQANGEWVWTPPVMFSCLDGVPESRKTAVALGWVFDRFLCDPGRFLFDLLPLKFHRFWGLDTVRHNLFLVLMVVGMGFSAASSDSRPRFLLWLPIGLFLAIHMAFYGFERYRYPILPGIHAYVALAIATFPGLFRSSRSVASCPLDAKPESRSVRSWFLMFGLLTLTIPVMLLAHRAMRPRVVYGFVSRETVGAKKELRANYWSTTDELCLVTFQVGGSRETPCETTVRRVHCCHFAPVPELGVRAPVLFTVHSPDRSAVLYRWSQNLP